MKDLTDFVNEVERFVNSASDKDRERFAELMATTVHRTLQQSFTKLCMAWIEKLATMDSPKWADARNQASVNMASYIMESLSGAVQYVGPDGKVRLPTI